MLNLPFRNRFSGRATMTRDYKAKYHEHLWGYRLGLAKDAIEKGETHPLRITKQLLSSYRLNPVTLNDDGSVTPAEETSNNPYDFPLLPTGLPAFRPMWVRSQPGIAPYYQSAVDLLVDFLAQNEFEAVVELGSGYGQNLIELYYHGGPKGIPYYAGEYTESGVELAAQLFSLIDDEAFVSFPFDIEAPDLSAVKERKKIFIFTRHALEQVEKIPEDFFATLASHAKEVTCVHFEPFGFQLKESDSEAHDTHRQYTAQRGFNTNMVEVLVESEKTGAIAIKYIGGDVLGGLDIPYQTSIAIWESRRTP